MGLYVIVVLPEVVRDISTKSGLAVSARQAIKTPLRCPVIGCIFMENLPLVHCPCFVDHCRQLELFRPYPFKNGPVQHELQTQSKLEFLKKIDFDGVSMILY